MIHIGHTTTLGQWLKRLEVGCPIAQEAVIEHTCDRLRVMAKLMLRKSPRVRLWADTDDLLQDAAIRLHRSLLQVKPTTPGEFYGLAATQLRRQLIDLARKHYGPEGIGTRHQLWEHEQLESIRPEQLPPESLEDWTAFHEQVNRLPNELYDVFQLLFYQGITQVEAAKTLGIGLATVKRRWQAARTFLVEVTQGNVPQ